MADLQCIMRLAASVLLCFLLLLPAAGCSKREKQSPVRVRQGWVNDYASILSAEEKIRFSTALEAYEKETCHQVFVLIIPTLAGESMADYSFRTATAWDIGQKGFGNGIILSIAMQEGTMRMETGPAFEWMIQNGEADKILKEVMVPYFKSERYSAGIEQGLAAIMEAARLKVIPEDHRPDICRR